MSKLYSKHGDFNVYECEDGWFEVYFMNLHAPDGRVRVYTAATSTAAFAEANRMERSLWIILQREFEEEA